MVFFTDRKYSINFDDLEEIQAKAAEETDGNGTSMLDMDIAGDNVDTSDEVTDNETGLLLMTVSEKKETVEYVDVNVIENKEDIL